MKNDPTMTVIDATILVVLGLIVAVLGMGVHESTIFTRPIIHHDIQQ